MILITILMILIVCLKYIYDQHQDNLDAELIELYDCNRDSILEKKQLKCPLLIHNHTKIDITLKDLIKNNPGYMIEDNNKLISFQIWNETNDTLSIYQNEKLCRDLMIDSPLKELSYYFTDKLNFYPQFFVSLYKGNNLIQLSENKHGIYLLKPIEGVIIVYLINPKHKKDIERKEETSIKKWSHRIELRENDILSIPTNWFFFYETQQNDCIIGSYQSDNYFTFLYNHLR